MAERRMFHTAVVESDAFLDMPIGAQALYFHLGMQADEDGFVNGPKQIARMLRRPPKELRILEENGFVFNFDGIMVITHWRVANSLKNDRSKPLRYPEIARNIFINDNKIYALEGEEKRSLFAVKTAYLESKRNPNGIPTEQNGTEQNITEQNITESNRTEHNRKKENGQERISPLAAGSVEMTQEPVATTAAGVVAVTPEKDENAPAIVPDFGNGGENYDDTYVLLHRFGKDVVKLNKDQIEGLRRIMDEVDLDIYVHRLAKQILEGNDPGAHYKTIKGWYEERRNGQYEA